MEFQKISRFILFIALCANSGLAFTKTFNCKLKVAGFSEGFLFDSVKHKGGSGGSFNDFVYFLAMKDEKISVKIQNTKNASQVQSIYSLSRDDFELSVTPGWDLSCIKQEEIKAVEETKPIKKLVLDDLTPLETFQADISFTAQSPIKVRYNVSTAKQRMRAVVFQKGRLYTTDDDVKRDLNGNWCILQVNLELDQDTMIEEGHNWQTVQYNTLNNSSSHTVYAWSFVDPAQGKVTQKFKRYVPFNMACQIKKGEVFNRKMWREITGDRVKLYYNP
ncbi:MAG: hypothetical protein ACJAT2_000310 [Bacteriovoracaceae bacterium]|jgi:hypothetical protein